MDIGRTHCLTSCLYRNFSYAVGAEYKKRGNPLRVLSFR
ncbi:hypothetical protein HMPREF7215_0500 [Pyramidobacter piscolens W5455]|uniref:Uncharacterized protein n=1 Tax=Pyramidobacter piscolens W5455 TaxID=352165 RepID=A0ABP2HRG4_9BACT|nr:hypothetical protein HMPREF7215_0500 [Pyramidobacter piscolens W5455]